MKKTILLLLITCAATGATGQVGFKINNKVSSIIETQQTEIKKSGGAKEKVFVTLDIIHYNYLDRIKDSLQLVLQTSTTELYKNSTGADGNAPFGQEVVAQKSAQISTLQEEVEKIQTQQDSLYFLYAKDWLRHSRCNFLNFGVIRSRAFFDIIYSNGGERFKALGNAGLSLGNNAGSLYSEIVSGNMGLFRVSLGTMVSSSRSQDSSGGKQEEAYQRLVNYGGNTVLSFEYPLAYVHSRNNQYNLISRFTAKGTADFPAFGTNTTDWAGSASMGLDVYADAALSNNQLRFFMDLNMNLIYGTDVFKANLGIDKNTFSFGQLSLGLVFLENFKISFIVATVSSQANLRNKSVIAGGQVLR